MARTTLSQGEASRLATSGTEFRSTVIVKARQLTTPHEWTSRSGSVLRGQPGDWVLFDGDDEWTITDEAFTASYHQRPDGDWEKRSTIRAVQLDGAVEVDTPEGASRAEAGDWLATSLGAGAWPIAANAFTRRYVPTEA